MSSVAFYVYGYIVKDIINRIFYNVLQDIPKTLFVQKLMSLSIDRLELTFNLGCRKVIMTDFRVSGCFRNF